MFESPGMMLGAMIANRPLITRGSVANGPCPNCGHSTLRIEKALDAVISYVKPSDIHCPSCGWHGGMGNDAYCLACGWTGLRREGWDDGQPNICPECGKRVHFVGQKEYNAHCDVCGWVGRGRAGCDDGRGNWCPKCKNPATLDDELVLNVITRDEGGRR